MTDWWCNIIRIITTRQQWNDWWCSMWLVVWDLLLLALMHASSEESADDVMVFLDFDRDPAVGNRALPTVIDCCMTDVLFLRLIYNVFTRTDTWELEGVRSSNVTRVACDSSRNVRYTKRTVCWTLSISPSFCSAESVRPNTLLCYKHAMMTSVGPNYWRRPVAIGLGYLMIE